MTSCERRVVHEFLRDRGDVETHSEGQEPDRHLVVSPKSGDCRVSRVVPGETAPRAFHVLFPGETSAPTLRA